MKKLLYVMFSLLLVVTLLYGCAPAQQPASETGGEAKTGEKPYIAIISKGFQHQFWQAVKAGAEKAATEYNVEITFEGPENESMVDKQVEMVQAALSMPPMPANIPQTV